jgi:putative N6-adenine-specific DNA methylase
VDHPSIRDTRFANQKCKDAIVDRLQKTCGRRAGFRPGRDRAVVHLFWKGQRVQIYLDTSGEPLSRRGYRKIPVKAPMQETLAAAIVLATGWSGKGAFVNPMCGSGTIAIEAP